MGAFYTDWRDEGIQWGLGMLNDRNWSKNCGKSGTGETALGMLNDELSEHYEGLWGTGACPRLRSSGTGTAADGGASPQLAAALLGVGKKKVSAFKSKKKRVHNGS